MANVITQNSVSGKGKFFPAGYNIQIPDNELIALIENRLKIEAGEREIKPAPSFSQKIIKKTTGRRRSKSAA